MSTERATYIIDLRDLFSPKLKGASDNLDKFEGKLKKTQNEMNLMGGLGGKLAGALTLTAIAAGTKKISDMGAEAAMTRTLFRTMLADIKKGDEMLNSLKGYATATPYMSKDIIDAGKTLLSFNVEAKKILPTIKTLGDVAAGNEQRFKMLSLAYAQTQSAGRLMGQDLLQMINAGFNPLQIISQKTGLSLGVLKKKMEDGAISARMVEKAFQGATEKGGLFYDMANKQSEQFGGKLSTVMDKLDIGLTKMGENLNDKLMPVLDKILEVLNHGDLKDASKKYNDTRKKQSELTTMYDAFKDAKGTSMQAEYEKMILRDFPELGTDFKSGESKGLSETKLQNKLESLRKARNASYVTSSEFSDMVSEKYRKIENLQNEINMGKESGLSWGEELMGMGQLSEGDIKSRINQITALSDEIKQLTSDYQEFHKKTDRKDALKLLMDPWVQGGGFGNLAGKTKKTDKDKVDGEVRSGGVKNITINIQQLVGEITFEKLETSETKVIEIIKRALMTSVNDANIAIQ